MNTQELQSRLQQQPAPLLLHVLPEEVFEARRIAGSCNACVYEMAFLSKVAELAPDKSRPIIVYGAGAGSLDAETARQKLAADGYTDVSVFEGGLEACDSTAMPVEGSGVLPGTPSLSGTFKADIAESVIRWTGRNLFNSHNGTVKLASGELSLRDNQLLAASFDIAMDSIACEDLTDSTWNQMLIQHLRSDDFFDVDHHPVARLTATSVAPIANATAGTPNFTLHGDFTLRGITGPVEFPVVIATADGARITAQGVLDLDRTQFGSVYGSGRFFRFLGKHIVNDLIHLHVKLHADRQS